MPSLKLDPDDLDAITSILQRWVPEAEVWAYGSRVRGNCHEASDLDLVIRNPQNLHQPTPSLGQLKQALKDSNVPILVDVMDWACLPEAYRQDIERGYVVVR